MELSNLFGGEPGTAQSLFSTLLKNIPADTIQKSLAAALQSDETPSTAQTVSQLFGNSDPDQKAGVLSTLVRAIGPMAMAGLAGGAFKSLAANGGTVTPAQAAQFTPQQVAMLADSATQAEPGIIEQLSKFCSEHPTMLSLIGTSVLAVVANSLKGNGNNGNNA